VLAPGLSGFKTDDDRPVRYPLSVFILSDMLELAQAHASYRFIISDEEDNRKLLVSLRSGVTQQMRWVVS
jgi:hypothetical protein